MIARTRTPSVASLLFALKGSIIPVIWPRVLYTILFSLLVVVLNGYAFSLHIGLSAAPLTLMGLTLAIFLGFRNTVAYQRWWDARTLWGELIIVTRNLTRQTLGFLADQDEPTRRQLVYRLIAFTHALRHHLRGSDPTDDLSRWLSADEAADALATPNRPNTVLGQLGRAYTGTAKQTAVDPILLASIDAQISRLSYVLGGCERIQGTPIPYAYILLLHRTVHIYCFLLPFCLVGTMGWTTPLVVGVLAYTFFGLDALGDQIEDPFDLMPNDLPLDAMSRNVEINLLSLLGDTDLPAPIQPRDFVLP
ncbi:putative membrane protein [Luteibacter sp. Sphag1AF]|uniref:bestrophin family protein n=1 Tax=Luteibacter sp. Sphag1AF TaxID=2587031 RepID=UPI00161DDFAA|nr:bestrophin family protein [Luteibacter sp. Sphag1AF]MBB3226611.1 putative membrane protein [Luteibacter sp. Sphag1AF]